VRPAPLVAPTGRRRWYYPVAAAAVIVLAVAVEVLVERERPDPESALARQAPAPRPAVPAENKAAAPAAKLERFKLEERRAQDSAESRAPEPARAAEAARADRLLGRQMVEPPEKWLERIAELRKEGRHEEADKALEEFRKRYPEHKVPESALRLPK
ncbi:MAG: hypothetical protein ACREUN_09565, partial [Burkholderiales bacterium]